MVEDMKMREDKEYSTVQDYYERWDSAKKRRGIAFLGLPLRFTKAYETLGGWRRYKLWHNYMTQGYTLTVSMRIALWPSPLKVFCNK